MRNISDIIEEFLLQTLGEDSKLNISRNELASYFSCAPSQINYVLSTRFTPERGYVIESRRGGGGFITVIRLNEEPQDIYEDFLSRQLNQGLSYNKACQWIDRFESDNLITNSEAELLKTTISDKALVAPAVAKDGIRIGILKAVFLHLIKKE